MKRENLTSDLKYFLVLLTLGSFILIPIANVSAAHTPPWHAGYFYFGYTGSAPDGVKAKIYTVSPTLPIQSSMFEWVGVMTSYSPMYWLQLGYLKRYVWVWIFPVVIWGFYTEKQDIFGHYLLNFGFPLSTHTYTFQIQKTPGAYFYRIEEAGFLLYSGNWITIPSTPVDLQVFAETTTSTIDIWTSHFTEISYYSGSSWNLWGRHLKLADSPYVVQQESHYEFYAWRS